MGILHKIVTEERTDEVLPAVLAVGAAAAATGAAAYKAGGALYKGVSKIKKNLSKYGKGTSNPADESVNEDGSDPDLGQKEKDMEEDISKYVKQIPQFVKTLGSKSTTDKYSKDKHGKMSHTSTTTKHGHHNMNEEPKKQVNFKDFMQWFFSDSGEDEFAGFGEEVVAEINRVGSVTYTAQDMLDRSGYVPGHIVIGGDEDEEYDPSELQLVKGNEPTVEAENESYSPGDEMEDGYVSNCCGANIENVSDGHGRCSDCHEMASAEKESEYYESKVIEAREKIAQEESPVIEADAELQRIQDLVKFR
jgi:uncharacterized membrane protein|tara:strand:+ start:63 stop:980 length:918 start_codon:yes stop_codon:yes gene_type:complete